MVQVVSEDRTPNSRVFFEIYGDAYRKPLWVGAGNSGNVFYGLSQPVMRFYDQSCVICTASFHSSDPLQGNSDIFCKMRFIEQRACRSKSNTQLAYRCISNMFSLQFWSENIIWRVMYIRIWHLLFICQSGRSLSNDDCSLLTWQQNLLWRWDYVRFPD